MLALLCSFEMSKTSKAELEKEDKLAAFAGLK